MENETESLQTRQCESCNGTGYHVHKAFEHGGKSYPERKSRCFTCDGAGNLPAPDSVAIAEAIRGRKPGTVRSAKPKGRDLASRRAAYVWRMARFHGGVDMTMPVMASLDVHGDPWRPELDALADSAARQAFGSDLRAARRWGRALGVLPG